MYPNHPEICLMHPEIPQNTGNIGRLAAATGSRLHLVKPLGFSTNERNLLRPGLDYWPYLDIEIHDHWNDLLENFSVDQCAFFSARATQEYTEIKEPRKLYIFGSETKGLPDSIKKVHKTNLFKIPIFHPQVRSLNLANAVSIVVYRHLEQLKSNASFLG